MVMEFVRGETLDKLSERLGANRAGSLRVSHRSDSVSA
jgi:hypothetical protein